MDEADPPHHVHRRELLRTDQTLVVDGTARPVRDLVVLCDPTAGTAACPLTGLEGIPLTLRNYTTRSVGKALGGAAILTVLAVTVGAVACGIACAEGSTLRLASEITIGVVGAGVLGLVGWIVIDCYLLSGGCHD